MTDSSLSAPTSLFQWEQFGNNWERLLGGYSATTQIGKPDRRRSFGESLPVELGNPKSQEGLKSMVKDDDQRDMATCSLLSELRLG